MKFDFNTIEGFGKITHQDFIHNPISFYPMDILLALELGLLPDEASTDVPMPWFASRSVRIRVQDFAPTKTSIKYAKRITVSELRNEEILLALNTLKNIFAQYITAKGYGKPYDIEPLLTNNLRQKVVLLYSYNDVPVAFCVLRVFSKAMCSLQFAWDYAEPKLSLGTVSQYIECEFAKKNGIIYDYLMPAYERGCSYKADFKGIEWYTGKNWSNDTEQLKQLMERDETFEINDNTGI